MPQVAAKRLRQDEPGSSRSRILDAAEALFAQRGYYGVSVREITREAGVQLALASYYFASKEELFRQVVARRADEHCADLAAALDGALAAAEPALPAVEAVIRAFLEPVLIRSLTGGGGWKNYIQVLAWAMNMRANEDFLRPLVEIWTPLNKRFVGVLWSLYPHRPVEDIHWAFYFLEASLIHILVEAGVVDRQSAGTCRSSDLEAILRHMVPYYAAAFARFGDGTGR
ncbi:MAG: TetR family transcriptional regulator [Alphaproteobacteria bacterium]|nr:TetR family transcriptional regulator [Alphaproteobacteria bacterium]